MRVAVVGATGQLGTDVVAAYAAAGHDVTGLTHGEVSIEDPASVGLAMMALDPDLVVNTAAMLDLEACERDPERAFAINALGALHLARCAAVLEHTLVQISTDYVFDGAKGSPYVESDATAPLNTYATSKLAGEHLVRATCAGAFVVRTCGLYGHAPCRAKGGLNFVEQMLQLATRHGRVRVVDDERVTPTTTRDVAANLVALTRRGTPGTYHMTAQGSCTWYEFTARILELVDHDAVLQRAAPGEFASRVQRPLNSVLDNRSLRESDLDRMPSWDDGLRWYLRTRNIEGSDHT